MVLGKPDRVDTHLLGLSDLIERFLKGFCLGHAPADVEVGEHTEVHSLLLGEIRMLRPC